MVAKSGLNIFANDPQIVRIDNAPWPDNDQELGSRLIRLKKLFEEGAITSDEYTRLRAPLLDRLR